MPGANQILNFSQDVAANVMSQAAYLADAQRVTGNQTGIARAQLVNKAFLQASAIAAGLAQFLADNNPAGDDVTDQLTPAEIAAMFISAMSTIAAPIITADTTWYVRTDGNDSNTGLTNDAAGAFATLQHAWDVAQSYTNTEGWDLTVQMGNGPWTTANGGALFAVAGQNHVDIEGDLATPANVTITTTDIAVYAYKSDLSVAGIKYICTNAGYKGTITVDFAARVSIKLNTEFGANTNGTHVQVFQGGTCFVDADYKISGGAVNHMAVSGSGSTVSGQSRTVTLSGTPAFSSSFIAVEAAASSTLQGMTYAGTGATGKRYDVAINGVINTFGGGASYFPGSIAGTTATGGQYA
jgi:hypothetical protein